MTWQGWAVLLSGLAIFVPCGIAWIHFNDVQPVLADVFGVIGFLAFMISHAVIIWKMDWGYSDE